jgi:ABC-type sulfate/molybdate transport systems ATPase subunit
MALLLVTHDRPQAERMAKRLLRMSDGGINQLSESAPWTHTSRSRMEICCWHRYSWWW